MTRLIFLRLCLVVCLNLPLMAQNGTFPYLVENLNNARLVQRGSADARGIPQSELILRPSTGYRLWMLEPITLNVGQLEFHTPENGRTFSLPTVTFRNPVTPDSDGDGLHNEAEFILGTQANQADSDGDGIHDGAEFTQGLNPLDGLVAQTGIIANAPTSGNAHDIAVANDLAVIVEQGTGISVFNIFNAMSPLVIGQIATPGEALAVTLTNSFAAVADGDQGLALIDLTDPPNAAIVRQLAAEILGGRVNCVTGSGNLIYAGTDSGRISEIEVGTGALLRQIDTGPNLQDLTTAGNGLYALRVGQLHTIDLTDGRLDPVSTASAPGQVGAGQRRWRIFAGGNLLLATHSFGYNAFDLSNPLDPQSLTGGNTTQRGWKQLVANGSGLAVGTVGNNSTNDGPHHVSLYDLSDPTVFDPFVTTIQTPGLAQAVAIFNGIAYVADGDQGLQAINYLAFDRAETPPVIHLTPGHGDLVQEGQPLLLRATVTDDVQVRNVEFEVDGTTVVRDGSFPFEVRIIAPSLAEQQVLRIRARASDTGGNITWTGEQVLTLVPDATAPFVRSTTPADGTGTTDLTALSAIWSEPIQTGFPAQGWTLTAAGNDGILGTGDDRLLDTGTPDFDPETLVSTLPLLTTLERGSYRAVIQGVRDLAGNLMETNFSWQFFVFGDQGSGLRAEAFDGTGTGVNAVRTHFEGLESQPFTVHDNGFNEVVDTYVVPIVDFRPTPFSGAAFYSVGLDEMVEPGSLATVPLGDDFSFTPPGGNNQFGFRFTGFIHIPTGGDVTFSVGVDDAFDLLIGETSVVSFFGNTGHQVFTGTATGLSAGFHPITLYYAENGGAATLVLAASGGGLPGGVVGPEFLIPDQP